MAKPGSVPPPLPPPRNPGSQPPMHAQQQQHAAAAALPVRLAQIARTLESRFLGKDEVIRLLLIAVVAGEHAVLVGTAGRQGGARRVQGALRPGSRGRSASP